MTPKPIAVPLDVDDLAVMQEPIEDSSSDNGVTEQLLPVSKAFVAGDNGGAFLITIGDELKE